jgi:hypothetical protein
MRANQSFLSVQSSAVKSLSRLKSGQPPLDALKDDTLSGWPPSSFRLGAQVGSVPLPIAFLTQCSLPAQIHVSLHDHFIPQELLDAVPGEQRV